MFIISIFQEATLLINLTSVIYRSCHEYKLLITIILEFSHIRSELDKLSVMKDLCMLNKDYRKVTLDLTPCELCLSGWAGTRAPVGFVLQ